MMTYRISAVVVGGNFLEKVENGLRTQKPMGCVIEGRSPGVPNKT